MRRVLPSVRPTDILPLLGKELHISCRRMRAIVNPNEREGWVEVGFGNAEAGRRMKHSLIAFLGKAKNGHGVICNRRHCSIWGEDCRDGRLLFVDCWFKNDGLILGESLGALTKLDCDLLMTLGTLLIGPFHDFLCARPMESSSGRVMRKILHPSISQGKSSSTGGICVDVIHSSIMACPPLIPPLAFPVSLFFTTKHSTRP
jgi:hypothetical protein